MKDPVSVLKRHPEAIPDWLAGFTTDSAFPTKRFFESRIVYYPGSGTDGHPLRIFGKKAHAAHCFVYADLHINEEYLLKQFNNPNSDQHPRGYKMLHLSKLNEEDLAPNGWLTSFDPAKHDRHWHAVALQPKFILFAVFERKPSFSDEHGPERLAYLHIGGDAYSAFKTLFCEGTNQLPYAILLQDHGMGGNWNNTGFGRNSLLWQMAMESNKKNLPKWLFVATENTEPWDKYTLASTADHGGMHGNKRQLFELNQSSSS